MCKDLYNRTFCSLLKAVTLISISGHGSAISSAKARFSLSRFKVSVHPGLMIQDEP